MRSAQESNLDKVRHAYAAHERGDLQGFLAPFDPDVAWEKPPGDEESCSFRGIEGVAEAVLGAIGAQHDCFTLQLDDVVADDQGRVVALGGYCADLPGGERACSSFAHVWRFRDGRAVEFRDFHERSVRIEVLERRVQGAGAETTQSLTAALSAKDSYTAEHAGSVAELACAVAERLGLSTASANALRYAALLHDIGKIAVPDAILHKPGPLTTEEWEVMRRHPEIGEAIIAPLSFLRATREIIRHDHERWDGGGYPDGLAGQRIPRGARIVCAVDAFHAMTSTRPYRSAMLEADARAELVRGAGTQFDPIVVGALLDVLDGRQAQPEPAATKAMPAVA